jgi:OFA family oxalate/formate antiporter-like MFS transporter
MSHSFERDRWLRVAVGTMMMLTLGTLYAWSIFRTPFGAAYPSWSAADLSLNFTISIVCYSLGGFFGGKLSKKTSNVLTARLGAVLILLGFWGTSMLPADPASARTMLYLCYGVLSAVGTGFGYNAILAGVSGWFPDKNGLSSGVMLTGFGLGTMLIGQLANVLIPVIGLSALFRAFAVVIAAVLLLGSAMVRLPGRSVKLPQAPASAKTAGGRDFATGEMVRQGAFWVFFLWNMLMCASGLLVINTAAGIAEYYGTAAVLGLLLSVFNGLSRIPFGVLVDRLGRERVMLLANGFLLLSGALLVLGGLNRSAVLVLGGMLIMGICYGNSVTIGTLVIRQFYGDAHYATNLAVINFCAIPACVAAPLCASALQEASGGDYTTTFLCVLALAAADLVVGFFVRQPKPSKGESYHVRDICQCGPGAARQRCGPAVQEFHQ